MIEIDDQEPGELSQCKRIQWLIAIDTRKVPQTKSAQFKLFSFFAGR